MEADEGNTWRTITQNGDKIIRVNCTKYGITIERVGITSSKIDSIHLKPSEWNAIISFVAQPTKKREEETPLTKEERNGLKQKEGL